MTRPLRLAFPGAIYHVTSRGNRRQNIYRNDVDRQVWLSILGRVCARHNWKVHAFCQMTNHHHLLIETIDPTIAQGMQQLNGHYSRYFNKRHELAGHVFQGRYHAILVDRQSYLLEVSRYVVLNPLRAGIVQSIDEWPWSSFFYCSDDTHAPFWLEREWLLGHFGHPRAHAVTRYRNFILAGIGKSSPLKAARHQVLLGDDAFVANYQHLQYSRQLVEAVRIERGAVALPLDAYRRRYANRDEAMARAYQSTAYTMPQIARTFDVSTKTVSRAVAAFERSATSEQA